jgi:nudix-type nucleoside diphosphatase (YffH/AdpP family)
MKIISDLPNDNNNGYFKINKLNLIGKKNQPVTREYLKSKDGVCSVIYDTVKDKYIFTKQFRPGPKIEIIEICAGMLDVPGESPIDAMKREILEEVGYQVDTINQIVKPYFSSPGKTNERLTIYFSTVSRKIDVGGGLGYENEEIDIVELTKDEIKRTDFIDGKTILALSVLKLK